MSLDTEVRQLGGAVIRSINDMMSSVAQMRDLLSRYGDKKFKEIRKLAGVPSWQDYLNAFAAEIELSPRTIQKRKLAELRGDNTDDADEGEEGEPEGRKHFRAESAYKAPTQREFRPYVNLAETVNDLIDEYDHPAEGEAPTIDVNLLRKCAIPKDAVGNALTGVSVLEQKVMVPFIAAAISYILTLENAVFYNKSGIGEEWQTRLAVNKDAWRSSLKSNELHPLYEAAKKLNDDMRSGSQVSVDGTPIEGPVQVGESAPNPTRWLTDQAGQENISCQGIFRDLLVPPSHRVVANCQEPTYTQLEPYTLSIANVRMVPKLGDNIDQVHTATACYIRTAINVQHSDSPWVHRPPDDGAGSCSCITGQRNDQAAENARRSNCRVW